MSGAITAAVGGAVVGGMISAKGSKDAAKTSARATKEASDAIIAETQKARAEILDRMTPALADYGREIDNLQSYVADGTVDVMQILSDSTQNAMQVLTQSGANAKQALLGSAASASGVPRTEFTQQYQQIQSLPPAQQNQAIQQAFPQAAQTLQSMGTPSTVASTVPDTTGTTYGADPAAPGPQYPSPFGERYAAGTQGFRNESSPIAQLAMAPAVLDTLDQVLYGDQTAPPRTEVPYQSPTTEAPDAINMVQNAAGEFVPAATADPAAGTGFYGAMQQLTTGEQRSLAQLAAGTGQARADVIGGREDALSTIAGAKGEALGRIQPYSEAGRSALDMEAALSGALGPEAQQQAINSFIESPGQQYLREQQEQALLRNQAAIGGLGGGRVRTALQEQAFGIASTQQQQYLTNLRDLAVRGQTADTTGASIVQSAGTQSAAIQQGAAAQLAQLAEALGVRGANLTQLTAQQKSELANQTGLSLAALEQAIGAAQAGTLAQLGGAQAAAYSGGLADIANLGQVGAANQLSGQQNIAQILANLATQSGSQVANLTAAGGSALAAGQAQSAATLGQTAQDVGNIAAYTLANRAAAVNPTPSTWAPAGNPTTDLVMNTGMSR